jgi:hypothetical protein
MSGVRCSGERRLDRPALTYLTAQSRRAPKRPPLDAIAQGNRDVRQVALNGLQKTESTLLGIDNMKQKIHRKPGLGGHPQFLEMGRTRHSASGLRNRGSAAIQVFPVNGPGCKHCFPMVYNALLPKSAKASSTDCRFRIVPVCLLSRRTVDAPGCFNLSATSIIVDAEGCFSINSIEINLDAQSISGMTARSTSVSDLTEKQNPCKLFLTTPLTARYGRGASSSAPCRGRFLVLRDETNRLDLLAGRIAR